MVPPLVEESHSHQGSHKGPNFGQNPYDDLHNNGGVSVSESTSETNNGGPLIGYQHSASGASPLQPYPLQAPPQSICTQACPQQCFHGNPAQDYLPLGSPQAVQSSWSSPSRYHPAPPACSHYDGPTTIPLGQGRAHRVPVADPSLPSTPKQTPSGAFGSVHSHSHLSQSHQVLRREHQSYASCAPPHTNSDQAFQHGVLYNNNGPVPEDEYIANSQSLQPTFPDFNLNTPITNVLNPHFINGQQQEPHGE